MDNFTHCDKSFANNFKENSLTNTKCLIQNATSDSYLMMFGQWLLKDFCVLRRVLKNDFLKDTIYGKINGIKMHQVCHCLCSKSDKKE